MKEDADKKKKKPGDPEPEAPETKEVTGPPRDRAMKKGEVVTK